MSKKLKGVDVSPGIGIGKVFLNLEANIVEPVIANIIPDVEKEKLIAGREKSKKQLEKIRENALKNLGPDKAAIFESHITMLEDEDMYDEIISLIDDDNFDAIKALKTGIKIYADMMANLEDPYLRERAADVRDVGKRWMYNIMGIEMVDMSNLPPNTIIVSKDLSPSDTAQLDIQHVLGFVTELGGKTSHSSLMARTMELPAVVGVKDICSSVKNNDDIILDGSSGIVILSPTDEEIKEYQQKNKEFLENKAILAQLKDKEAISLDGTKVEVLANIGSPDDIDGVIRNGAAGIGLYRTEFLFMNKDRFPTEDEQYEAYKIVAEKMNGKPVTIRTMDIGGDKSLPYMDLPNELNPFLGWRAIRICLDRPEILKTQFRALLKASVFGNIKIMLPMIVSVEEIRKAKKILEECKDELRKEGIKFDEKIKLGIMIETPAAIISADDLAKECDFFSIGTNDLTQYVLAVDRGNENISKLYDTYDPSVLKSIKIAIDAAHRNGITISMCGEFSGDIKATPILFGMGLDGFSMSAISVPGIKKAIMGSEKGECIKLVEKVMSCVTSKEIKNILGV